MGLSKRVQSWLIDVDRPGNRIRDLWDKLHDKPAGRRLFSQFIGQAAPYTGSVGARIEELRQGYARGVMKDRRRVRNHLNSVHAVALVNLAELTGNAAIAYSMPEDARFIVAGLQIKYLKKARGTITAESHCPVVSNNDRQTYQVPVTLSDPSGQVVAEAELETLIGPKKRVTRTSN